MSTKSPRPQKDGGHASRVAALERTYADDRRDLFERIATHVSMRSQQSSGDRLNYEVVKAVARRFGVSTDGGRAEIVDRIRDLSSRLGESEEPRFTQPELRELEATLYINKGEN